MDDPKDKLVPTAPPLPAPAVRQVLSVDILPVPEVHLTPELQERADRLQDAFKILGPAAGGALVCPGNQEGVPDDEKCPYSAHCIYLKAKRAPQGDLCPLEAQHIHSKYAGWCNELQKTPDNLLESERAFISELVWIDVQEQRCASIVAKGRAAKLTQMNPKEVHPDTLEAISWEQVIHANVERLDQLSTARRMLLRDWMITPEQKAKKARWEGKSRGDDPGSRQAARTDALRKISEIIDSE